MPIRSRYDGRREGGRDTVVADRGLDVIWHLGGLLADLHDVSSGELRIFSQRTVDTSHVHGVVLAACSSSEIGIPMDSVRWPRRSSALEAFLAHSPSTDAADVQIIVPPRIQFIALDASRLKAADAARPRVRGMRSSTERTRDGSASSWHRCTAPEPRSHKEGPGA